MPGDAAAEVVGVALPEGDDADGGAGLETGEFGFEAGVGVALDEGHGEILLVVGLGF